MELEERGASMPEIVKVTWEVEVMLVTLRRLLLTALQDQVLQLSELGMLNEVGIVTSK